MWGMTSGTMMTGAMGRADLMQLRRLLPVSVGLLLSLAVGPVQGASLRAELEPRCAVAGEQVCVDAQPRSVGKPVDHVVAEAAREERREAVQARLRAEIERAVAEARREAARAVREAQQHINTEMERAGEQIRRAVGSAERAAILHAHRVQRAAHRQERAAQRAERQARRDAARAERRALRLAERRARMAERAEVIRQRTERQAERVLHRAAGGVIVDRQHAQGDCEDGLGVPSVRPVPRPEQSHGGLRPRTERLVPRHVF